jgi:hypothetical protein
VFFNPEIISKYLQIKVCSNIKFFPQQNKFLINNSIEQKSITKIFSVFLF